MDSFRTGTFHYQGQDHDVTVIRTEEEQIERYNDGKSEMISSIEWTSDTSYRLVVERGVNAPGCLEEGDTVRTRIVGCEGDRMTCKTRSDQCGGTRSVLVRE